MKANPTTVLLIGPTIDDTRAAYGGGTGGYTRNMSTYLKGMLFNDIRLIPCFLTVRGADSRLSNSYAIRWCIDIFRFLVSLAKYRPQVIHVLGTYSDAVPRESFFAAVALIYGSKLIYEIKGGRFEKEYVRRGLLYQIQIRFILYVASVIGIEGLVYMEFCRKLSGKVPFYIPNVCLDSEVPQNIPDRFKEPPLRVTFVGYCYEGKGVYELVQGCIIAASNNIAIELTLVGEKDSEFASWLRDCKYPPQLTVHATGRLPHEQVQHTLAKSDVFILPSRHAGEGHNNSVNEALMNGCLVVTTRHGFLEEILPPECCVFLKDCTPQAIASALQWVHTNPDDAQARIFAGRELFMKNFVSSIVFERVVNVYRLLSDING